MNRKSIFSVVMAISVVLLAACSAANNPTATTSNNNNVVPTTVYNSNTAATMAPTIVGNPNTSAPTTVGGINSNLACSNGATSASQTVEETEGPYYKSGSPEQADLFTNGMTGTKIVISGYVYDTNCKPVANAWLDFWQADANGSYDNNGYTLRGHLYTDAEGHYQLTTVVPGLYPGRTEHIHVKVQAPNGKILTSQLFFPGVSQNDSDGIYNATLLLSIQQTSDGLQGQFNFVVPAQ
jgi:protocatechuate 3,4-dioxygenase beta subunit